MTEERELNDRQDAFCAYYTMTLNKAEAARLAGYSPDSAAQIGYENMQKPHIRAKVDDLLRARRMSSEELLVRLNRVAEIDIGELLDSEGNFDLARAKAEGKTWMIRSINRKVSGSGEDAREETRVEVHDSLSALRSLMKPHGLEKIVVAQDEENPVVQALRELKFRAPWATQPADELDEDDLED